MSYYDDQLKKVSNDGTIRVKFTTTNNVTNWLQVNAECKSAIKDALFTADNDTITRDIAKLCRIICNSSPDQTIKGEIESLALAIGHHPAIIKHI